MNDVCKSIADVVANVHEIIANERECCPEEKDAEFFFRGESRSHYDGDDFGTSFQSSLDRLNLVQYERDIFNDAMRLNVADFDLDRTMPERIARMQHYQLPTRFADISENVLTALFFAVSKGYGSESERSKDEDGYIRVIKIAKFKMKQYNSDIIIAISHLPLVKNEQIKFHEGEDGIDYLRYEITNSRPGFGVAATPDIKRQLIDELQQVWAFRPLCNSRRLRNQAGAFLVFGCGDGKTSLNPSFAPSDYEENCPSRGIKQIAYIRIAADAKEAIREELRLYGISEETVYPELANVNAAISNRYRDKLRSKENEI